MDYSRYPDNWKQFSAFIRFERAGNKCEKCGVPNYHLRYKSEVLPNGEAIIDPNNDAEILGMDVHLCDDPVTISKIILTVAHLDGIGDICQCEAETGKKCADENHVLALCQKCHLLYDIERHKFNRRRSRAASVGQLWLGDIEHRYEQKQEAL